MGSARCQVAGGEWFPLAGRTEHISCHICCHELRSVCSSKVERGAIPARGTHRAHFPPLPLAGNAPRAFPRQESRSVHAGNPEKRQDMRSVRANRNARSAYPASWMHAAHFTPLPVARTTLRAFKKGRVASGSCQQDARSSFSSVTYRVQPS